MEKKDIVKMTAKYSNDPLLVPEANFTQTGAVNITPAPASFSSGRNYLHNEMLPRQQSPNKHWSRQSGVVDTVWCHSSLHYCEDIYFLWISVQG